MRLKRKCDETGNEHVHKGPESCRQANFTGSDLTKRLLNLGYCTFRRNDNPTFHFVKKGIISNYALYIEITFVINVLI